MNNAVIQVENLSKLYRLGEIGTGTISRDLERWWARIRGKEDPFLRIGETNDRTSKGSSNIVWSLKDLNFEINQGDAVGIIGRNGAGKSTLLKVLSRVTAPTAGSVKVKGRVASLLEVGTGFHPELTGRENIFLNGAILGMRKKEIVRKLDEIIDFAGVERYVDTPVKRYSSGMYVRLAFAVAAHLESEILIVDEVLAVGDAEFQKKCLGKMGEVSKGEGRTVLFVSHNMGSVAQLCNKGILLDKSRLQLQSDITETVSAYLNLNNSIKSDTYTGNGLIKNACIRSANGLFTYNSSIELKVEFIAKDLVKNLVLGVVVKDALETSLIAINNKHYTTQKLHAQDVKSGKVSVKVDKLKLLPGEYKIDLHLGDSTSDLEIIKDALYFTVEDVQVNNTPNTLNYSINKIFIKDISWQFTNHN